MTTFDIGDYVTGYDSTGIVVRSGKPDDWPSQYSVRWLSGPLQGKESGAGPDRISLLAPFRENTREFWALQLVRGMISSCGPLGGVVNTEDLEELRDVLTRLVTENQILRAERK